MKFRSASVRQLALLALAYLNAAGAQVPAPPELPVDALAQTLPLELAQPFEQAWDVVELAGQPTLADGQRPARVVLRPGGQLWVDGGCNYFSGRVERDSRGLFRVSKYGSAQRACDKPPRSEAFLNSALMMVDNFRWDRGLLLRNGSSELLRLRPSANQDLQAIEQGVAHRALPPTAAPLQPAQANQLAGQNCRPVKASKGAGKSRKARAPVCQPLQAKANKVTGKAGLRGAKASKPAKAGSKARQVRPAKKSSQSVQKRSKS